jgi:hypothetical protein
MGWEQVDTIQGFGAAADDWTPVGNVRGPAGPPGPPGPPGNGEGGGGYTHTQQDASTVWDIQHNLGYNPAGVRVVDTSGDVWLPVDLTYPTPGQVARLTFPQTIAGTAWLS